MKTKLFFALLIAALAALACQPSDPAFEPSLEVSGTAIEQATAAAAGETLTFAVKSNLAYTVSSNMDWATVSPAVVENADKKELTTTISVTVDPNTTEEGREAAIKISTDGYSSLDYTFTVKQSAAQYEKSLVVLNSDLTTISGAFDVEAADANVAVMVVSTVSWTATVAPGAEWLAVEPASVTVENYEETPTVVTLKIADNNTADAREATVTFAGEGVEDVVVTVKQAGKTVYTFNIDAINVEETTATIVCKPSDANVHYLLSCETARYVNQFATGEELAAADIEYFRGVYGNNFANFNFSSFEDLFYNGLCDYSDKEWAISKLSSSTDYVAYVFAVDAELNVVSEVFKKEFTTKESTASEEYLKWTGSWKITGANDVVNNCTITAVNSNATYSIAGLQGFSDEINCQFNSADGSMSIMTTDLEDFTHNTYGPIDLWYLGTYTNGDRQTSVTGNYVICTAKLTDNTHATATGNTLQLSDGSQVELSGMEFIGKILEGSYAGYVLSFGGDVVSFPLTFEKVESTSAAAADNRSGRSLLKSYSVQKCAPAYSAKLR